jgi:hypothetical protein
MLTLESCNAGTLYTVTATFAEEDGVITDPTTVTLEFSQGRVGYTVNTWIYQGVGSITRSSTGVYVAELDTTDLPGQWVGEWIGTGACQATQPFTFAVTALPL